jgi:hypothetical protein
VDGEAFGGNPGTPRAMLTYPEMIQARRCQNRRGKGQGITIRTGKTIVTIGLTITIGSL